MHPAAAHNLAQPLHECMPDPMLLALCLDADRIENCDGGLMAELAAQDAAMAKPRREPPRVTPM